MHNLRHVFLFSTLGEIGESILYKELNDINEGIQMLHVTRDQNMERVTENSLMSDRAIGTATVGDTCNKKQEMPG